MWMNRLGGLTAAVLFSCSEGEPRNMGAEPLGTTPVAPVSFDALYVVNGESATISVINTETNDLAGTIGIRGIAYPYQISLNHDGTRLVLAVPGYDMSGGEYGHEHHSSRRGRILLLEAATGALKGATFIDAASNNAVFAPNGDIWTSQATNPGSTLVLDPETLGVRAALSVGTSPTATSLTGDGSFAFVANAGSGSVSVIDVPGRRVVTTIRVGVGPVVAQPAADGFVYVEDEADHSIVVIDVRTLSVVRTVPIGYAPGTIAVPDGGQIWVSSPERGVVEVRDASGAVTHTIETGRGARRIVFSASSDRAYVANELEDTVSVVDRATFSTVAKIPVGAKPNGMVWRARPAR